MPTAAEYAKSGGYARDAQISKNFSNTKLPPSSSSGGSSSRSSSSSNKTSTPPSGGYMSVPKAGGSVPPPSSYQSGGSTYTPGPSNWGGMDQSQRDAYTSGVMGPGMIKRGGSAPPNNKISVPGSWQDGVPQGGYVPGMINKISIPGQWGGTPAPYSPTPGSNQYKIAVPGQWGGTSAPPSSGFPVKTPEAIAAEAKAKTDALLARRTTISGQTKTGFQTAFDRLKATTKDDRTMADTAFQRQANPFSGATDYAKATIGRQRELTDQQSQQDLATRMANVDMDLADYANATEADRMKMEDEMTQRERAYGLQVDQLALQRQGQSFNQGIAEAGVTGRYNGRDTMQQTQNQFNNGIAQAGLTGRYNEQDTMQKTQNDTINNHWQSSFDQVDKQNKYNQGQKQIENDAQYGGVYNPSGLNFNQINEKRAANSAEWFNATPERQTQLHEENLYLASLVGSKYDPSTGDYSQGNNYVGTQTLEARNQQFNQGVTLEELAIRKDSTALANDLAKLQIANYPEEQRLKIEQMKKQIDQIGKAPYQSRQDLEMDQIRLETAKLQYNQLKTGKSVSPTDIITELNKSTFVEYDEDTKRPVVYDAHGLGKAILSRTSDAKERAYLFSYYNIDPNKLLQQLSGN